MEGLTMNNPSIEVADVFRAFWPQYQEQYKDSILPSHLKVASDIMACMTEEMGGSKHRCNDCSTEFWTYHGCRNRSCPKCHGRQTMEWLEKRSVEVLPGSYFHVVATVPAELHNLFKYQQKIMYGILLRVASKAVIEIARERRYVGGEPGVMAVLHTWTSKIEFHPHAHLLVTGGGLDDDGKTWHEAPSFLVPAKKLSPLISRRFREELEKKHPDLLVQIPDKVWKKEWCSFVDCKDNSKGQDVVLKYLARYVFRIAISNNRIQKMDESDVTFKYKENSTGNWRMGTISGIEFIRRFLMHVLPKGFHKIRYFGLWSPGKRSRLRSLSIALQLLMPDKEMGLLGDLAELALEKSEIENHGYQPVCPKCKSKNSVMVETRRRYWMRFTT
jgi:predicted Zn-ribbon and HTH transcriptional regulator